MAGPELEPKGQNPGLLSFGKGLLYQREKLQAFIEAMQPKVITPKASLDKYVMKKEKKASFNSPQNGFVKTTLTLVLSSTMLQA